MSRYLEISAPFEELQQRIETDLAKTGFEPKNTPPSAEPDLPDRLSTWTEVAVKDLYDKTLKFYGYLCDQITRYESYLSTTKRRLDVTTAVAIQEANEDKGLKNAEVRGAYVDDHPAVKSALYDYLYFNQMSSAQEERRKKLSKYIERIYRELALRHNQPMGASNMDCSDDESRRAKLGTMFIRRDDE